MEKWFKIIYDISLKEQREKELSFWEMECNRLF